MVRAWIVGSGAAADQWVVRDDLGNSYTVPSGVPGFAYTVGREYSLFAPDGKYDTPAFALYPYRTNRRWRDVGDLAKTHPATAAMVYMQKEKFASAVRHDAVRTIQDVNAGYVTFQGGGCAPLLTGQQGMYQAGDVVNVGNDVYASAEFSSPAPSGAGSAGCKKTGDAPFILGLNDTSDAACGPLAENWLGYNGAADLVNGGASEPPPPPSPGVFIYRKIFHAPNTITEWNLAAASCYQRYAAVYGPLCAANAFSGLTLHAGTIELSPNSVEYANFSHLLPRPILMPPQYTGRTAVIAPPAAAATPVNRKLKCGSRELRMELSLTTEDTHGHYTDVDGEGSGVMLPGCMILVFDKAPFPDYLGAGNINADLMLDGDHNGVYNSIYQTNLDEPFKLVYARPAAADFSLLRVAVPGSTRAGHYALKRPLPRRTAGNGITPITATMFRNKFNAPMDDPETGFGEYGRLLTRIFDYAGTDITAAPWWGDYIGGYFPGFFELPSPDATVNLHRDFLAAYPFMANPAINPSGELPRLNKIVFYAQGKIWFTGGGDIGGNPSTLVCGGIRLYHQ